MLDRSQFEQLSKRIFSLTGFEQTEAAYFAERRDLTRFANNAISQNVNQCGELLGIRVVDGKRTAKVETNQLDETSLRSAIERLGGILKYQKESDRVFALQGAAELREVNLFESATAKQSPLEKVEAIRCAGELCGKAGYEASGSYVTQQNIFALATSKGFFGFTPSTEASFAVTATRDEVAGWARDSHRDVRSLQCKEVVQHALDKARLAENPREIEPGEYTVILEPHAVANLMYFIAGEFNGLTQIEKRCFMAGKLGQKIWNDKITIWEDPYDARLSVIPFDQEGTPRQKVCLVERGTIKAAVHDRYSAMKAGAQSTGHSVEQPNSRGPMPVGIVVEGGDSSVEDMIAKTQRGILVTQFHYTNALDPMRMTITGLTRNGTYMVENGKIAYAIKNMRFTESMVKAFNNVEAVSKEQVRQSAFFGGGFVLPALKIRDFNFSSKTGF